MKLFDKLYQYWRHRHLPQSKNVDEMLYDLAARESAEYVIRYMKKTPNYDWDYDLHEAICRQLDPTLLAKGYILEFGVATGRTIRHLSKFLPKYQIWGFDSFQGLPEDWSWLFPKGSFKNTKPRVPNNVHLVEGMFDQTLPGWCSNLKGPIALLHIDCDLYSSTKTVLDLLDDRLVVGTVIVFDEYLNFPGWQQDEFGAWQNHVMDNNIEYEYIGRVGKHQQVAIKITKRGTKDAD